MSKYLSKEELYRIAFTSAKMDFWKIDLTDSIITVGDYIQQYLGIDKDTLSFDEALDFISSNERIEFLKKLNLKTSEVVIPIKDSRKKDNYKITAYATHFENDYIVGYAKIGSETYVQEQASETNDRQKQDNKLAFLANMSHDLRTPLNSIVGFSKILAESDDENEKKEYLKIILDNNDMLLRLINDILDLSKIEAGTLEMNISMVDINSIITEITKCYTMKMANTAVKFILDTPKLDKYYINTDPSRLIQVINNLLSNSIKFTSTGSITLKHTIKSNFILFEVIDTGIGIDKDKLSIIFNRFVSIDNNVRGTGLGLEISSSIINKLGGDIGVESTIGEGIRFWFTIPNNANSEIIDNLENSCDVVENKYVEKKKGKILVAEDDSSNYKLCEVLLKDRFTLIHAWTGSEAVTMFEKNKPNLILMDINMPEMDGYQAVKEIRKHSWDVPIIAVTAYALADDEEKILESGFDAYIPKPIDVKTLNNTINKFFKE